jgi:tetratricopeptide (TPR) repeat protein
LLLGIALDCSGNPKSVTQLFGEIWNSDLDPQEQTADLRLVQTAFQSGWNPSLHTSEAIYLVALLCYRTGEYAKALGLLNSAGSPISQSWSYYNLLGSIYLRQARFAEAESALTDALKRDDRKADTFYKLGTAALATEHTTVAINYFKDAIKLRPDFPGANAALGIGLLQIGDAEGARGALEKGTSLGPEIFLYLGEAYERLNDSSGAIEAYKSAANGNLDLFPALFSAGRLLLRQGKSQQAIEYLQHAVEIKPDHPDAQLYLGMAFFAAGKLDLAKAAALRASEVGQSRDAAFHDALGTLLKSVGDSGEAQLSFARAVKLNPDREEYFRHLAASQIADSEENAIATLRAGIDRIPKSAQLHYLLGLMLLNRGSTPEAANEARKATELEPGDPEYLQSFGVCLATQEKDVEAMHTFQQVLALRSSYAPALLQIGVLEQKSGSMDEAEKRFKQAMEADRDYAPAYFRLGKIYYDRNQDAEALGLLEKARELDSDWEDTYFLLGMLYRRKGDVEKANSMLAVFRQKKNELQNIRRKTYEKASSALDLSGPKLQ